MLVQALYNIVDSAFVARISEDALTAVSLAFPVQLLMIAVATGAGVGVNALLSRRLGQKKQAEADAVAVNGIFLSICFWLVFAVLGLLFGRDFIALFTDVPAVVDMGAGYVTVVTTASCGVFLLFVAERLMQATGNTVYHMVTQLIGALLNCVLDPILIFGLFGCPALGTTGAALATVLSQITAMSIGFFINVRFNRDVRIHVPVSYTHLFFARHVVPPFGRGRARGAPPACLRPVPRSPRRAMRAASPRPQGRTGRAS